MSLQVVPDREELHAARLRPDVSGNALLPIPRSDPDIEHAPDAFDRQVSSTGEATRKTQFLLLAGEPCGWRDTGQSGNLHSRT